MADQTRTNIGGGSQTHVKYEETDVCRRLNKKNTVRLTGLTGKICNSCRREISRENTSKENLQSKDTRNNFKQALNHRNWEWKPGGDRNCFNESYPIEVSYWGMGWSLKIIGIDVLQQLKINITFLNITQLSVNRKDGHTTVYTKRNGELLTKEKADPKNFADCIHWCLPGIPDAWNEIMIKYNNIEHVQYNI
ncbi:LOW QUALITY PROTEIN: PC-Esterase [Dillenia turbinata]|uniref:PC-Esterase n=1 Tax=Dillenia turbinata TaxID=194707 RepID=A0AAN8VUA5_9MAGN